MRHPGAEEMIALARTAQPAWGTLTVSRRCEYLARIRLQLARQCGPIANLIASECSKHPLDALSGDVLVSLEHLRYCEKNAPRVLRKERLPKPSIFFRGARFERHYEPRGVALIFGASNYPLQLSLIPLTTALAAGNAVILKCSERTPEVAGLIARLCAGAGLPKGIVQVSHAGPSEGHAMIAGKPDFIFFTGSSNNGRKVAAQAAEHLIPGVYELGGKDASIVFADCHMERAIEGILYGAFSNAGRACVAVKRAYIEASIYEEFLTRLTKRAASLRIGQGLDVDLPQIPKQDRLEISLHVQDALAGGAKLHMPIDADSAVDGLVILSDVPTDARLLSEESFGAVLCVAPFADEPQAVALANSTPFALSSSVWTRDRRRARRIAGQLDVGSCAINDVIRVIANPYASFGGNGMSGYGRYHGPEGLRGFARTKTVMLMQTRRKREINWFPFHPKTVRQLALLLRLRHGSSFWAKVTGAFLLLLLSSVLPVIAAAQSQSDVRLSIMVELTADARGELGYLIFSSDPGFPGDRDKAFRHGFAPIPLGQRQVQIPVELPPGTYAISLYNDRNGNHKLDHNWLGIPREPVGASNNPRAHFGPPTFKESSFALRDAGQAITIRLVHP